MQWRVRCRRMWFGCAPVPTLSERVCSPARRRQRCNEPREQSAKPATERRRGIGQPRQGSPGLLDGQFAEYLLPRFVIPSNFGLPPVVTCLDIIRGQAERSRPRLNGTPSPIAATNAVAFITPMPGMVARRWAAGSLRAILADSS